MTFWTKRLCLGLFLCLIAVATAHAQLRGHGGPVKALAISPDGAHATSGSFDTSAIRWSLSRNTAEQVLRFHDGAVNAVAYLKDGRVVTGGADARIAIWTAGHPQPEKVFDGHSGPVSNLAVSPDGSMIAYHSYGRGGIWIMPARGGAPRQVATAGSHPAWSADGRRIAFQSDEPSDVTPSAFGARFTSSVVSPLIPRLAMFAKYATASRPERST